MRKIFVSSVAAFWLFTASPRCVAQEVVDVIRLSTAEAAKARQVVEDFKSAHDRDNRARTAWQNFYQVYQAEHPELSRLRFSSDFRVAFGTKRPSDSGVAEAAVVELSTEERQKAESMHREMLEAKEALNRAQKNWQDYQYELVAGHIPSSEGGTIITLPNGRSVTIPNPWTSGVTFTPDFGIGVPR